MKITIDTKEDSKEEIRKIVQMLSGIVNIGNKDVYVNKGNMFSDDNDAANNVEEDKEEVEKVESAFNNIFNSPSSNTEEKKESTEETKEETEEENKEEDIKIDIPQVMEY
tara:strand:+ start:3670 stop:3999 length:330 start_codon:yes stop_codon:yes gene_type:complete